MAVPAALFRRVGLPQRAVGRNVSPGGNHHGARAASCCRLARALQQGGTASSLLSVAWCVCQAAGAATRPPYYAANDGRGVSATLRKSCSKRTAAATLEKREARLR
jgi:hypothetical protein